MIWLLIQLSVAAIAPTEAPVEGVEVVLEIRHDDGRARPGETVRVVHRPGLSGERELAIGITDGLGRVRWTPDEPGVAVIRAGDETLPIRIQHDPPPFYLLLWLLLLALAALAALIFGCLPSGKQPKAA